MVCRNAFNRYMWITEYEPNRSPWLLTNPCRLGGRNTCLPTPSPGWRQVPCRQLGLLRHLSPDWASS